jgi:hypothetical protein
MLKKILIVLVLALISFIIFVSSRPEAFQVTRSVKIFAEDRVVFRYVNDQIKWNEWSPWVGLDRDMKQYFSGELKGAGSIYQWSGNDRVGAGTSTIIESRYREFVKLRLDCTKPFKATYISAFSFMKRRNNSEVSWTIYGERNFIAKLIGVFTDNELVVAKDLEKGLAKLKSVTEAAR